MGKKIWIDAGHGGSDPGAVGPSGRTEKADNLTYANELARLFRNRGYDVIMTRTADVTMTLADRTAMEVKAGCALALSCHRNAGINDTANGFEVWVHSKAPQAYVDWGNDICSQLQKLGFKIRGTRKGYVTDPNLDYAINRDTKSPSMLLEVGFVTNTQDNSLFDTQLPQICTAIVDSCVRFMGDDVIVNTPAVPPAVEGASKGPYVVYKPVGRFHDPVRATEYAATLAEPKIEYHPA